MSGLAVQYQVTQCTSRAGNLSNNRQKDLSIGFRMTSGCQAFQSPAGSVQKP